MTRIPKHATPGPQIDPEALFKKLGLTLADERPILSPWREANIAWRRERAAKVADLATQVDNHLRRYQRNGKAPIISSRGHRTPVWCVEIRRQFASLTAAAKFVGKGASNIHQSLTRGVQCGGYHWEKYDASRHRQTQQPE